MRKLSVPLCNTDLLWEKIKKRKITKNTQKQKSQKMRKNYKKDTLQKMKTY